ncbi:MAG TPA: EthD domain-containing protein [Steroidobacteraceae bacterium]|jgi:hypothetical protein
MSVIVTATEQVKAIVLLTPKPGISRADFKAYYLNHHAPMNRVLLPMLGTYRLRFLASAPTYISEGAHNPDFGVVTELGFKDEEAFRAFQRVVADPVSRGKIDADEDNFADRSQTRLIRVEEVVVA